MAFGVNLDRDYVVEQVLGAVPGVAGEFLTERYVYLDQLAAEARAAGAEDSAVLLDVFAGLYAMFGSTVTDKPLVPPA